MTDMDIVDRLRTYGRRPHRICLEAADEIERLRDAMHDERKRCAKAVHKALIHSSRLDVARVLALEAIEEQDND